ncbi:unnamed protein product [Triticum turgidum subsp. durum]|uniref:Phosphate transporter n=1 Tax=Triticum turgidum subsp. durum TaxID=4567 RepID=A0A9R0Y1V5_TRITD|nr:unnamed protein product [Triticum turgidum subsp. durum]
MSQSSPFFSIAPAHAGAGGQAAAAALLLRCPAAQLPPAIHCFRLAKVSPAKTLSSHLVLPRATLSSFANADDGSGANSDASGEQSGGSELSEMAKAFHISPRMAMSISVVIAFAALTVPLAMRSLLFHGTTKMKVLAYLTLLSGFYMAWNIGANDVANAMGTSVGSGALTLRQAVLTAAVLEFSGAFLMGTHVTSTMQKGILVTSVFQGNDSLLFAGLLSSLAAAGTWEWTRIRAPVGINGYAHVCSHELSPPDTTPKTSSSYLATHSVPQFTAYSIIAVVSFRFFLHVLLLL